MATPKPFSAAWKRYVAKAVSKPPGARSEAEQAAIALAREDHPKPKPKPKPRKEHKFHVVRMPNGIVVSIQNSASHACDQSTVEVAVIRNGRFIEGFPHEDNGVAIFVNAVQLVDILNWAREQP